MVPQWFVEPQLGVRQRLMDKSIFAMELCFRLLPESSLGGSLRHAITSHPERASADERSRFYRFVTDLLLENLSIAERGCWDYFDDPGRAENDFDGWREMLSTQEGLRKSPSGPQDAYQPSPRYLTFTMAMLIVHDTPTDRSLAGLCDIRESDLWRRSTFARILKGVRGMSFASVVSDVAYLVPGDAAWGFTAEDLAQPKFQYLRTLVDR
jgi:hypothetical protein